MEKDRKLCPGHFILWERSPFRYALRSDAFDAWVQSLAVASCTNGVTHE